jgi:hypothetical protein
MPARQRFALCRARADSRRSHRHTSLIHFCIETLCFPGCDHFSFLFILSSTNPLIQLTHFLLPLTYSLTHHQHIHNNTSTDQTGSGKTLAYLTPILQRMTEATTGKGGVPVKARSPIVVIITPTMELAV